MKKMLILTILALFTFALPLSATASDYDHEITVDKLTFSWSIDGDGINIQLSGKTEGWVAVGFSPSKMMKDADIAIGYVKGGKTIVTDHFGTSSRQHKLDKKLGGDTNLTNIEGEEKNGVTTLRFTRPLAAGEDTDKAIVPDGDTTVILAYSTGRDSFRTRHDFRTTLTVNLSTGEFSEKK